jgi:hypothetical protein
VVARPAKPPRRHRFGLPALRRILAGIPALLFALVIYGYLALPDVRSLATENILDLRRGSKWPARRVIWRYG